LDEESNRSGDHSIASDNSSKTGLELAEVLKMAVNVTGEGIIRLMYSTAALKYVQGSEVQASSGIPTGGIDLKALDSGVVVDEVSSALMAMPAPFDLASFTGFRVEFESMSPVTPAQILAKR
jgi:hypothetical protein